MEKRKMTAAILSLSLLTVMAGAAVAPALNVISAHFSDADPVLIHLIISAPALFIVVGNLIFPALAVRIKSRTLVLLGLLLYVFGGCLAGAFNNIYIVLIFRALVGLGVGIIMPMSTGLLAYYYDRAQQDNLMGYSSAMNQLGGVVATLLAGWLALISWRAAFLVYLMGLISIVLCLAYLPNEFIAQKKEKKKQTGSSAQFYPYIIAMFLLMCAFFLYPSNYAMETAEEGVITPSLISIIMAAADLVAFAGGLAFVHIKRRLGDTTKIIAPVLFTAGYVLFALVGGWTAAILGSACIGFANGVGIPYLISTAAKKAGRSAATTVLPMISMAMYLAQFLIPFIQSALSSVLSPYMLGVAVSALFIIWSVFLVRPEKT